MDNCVGLAEFSVMNIDDAVSQAWERTLGVPAHRDDRLFDVLANRDGAARSQQLGLLLSEIAQATGVELPLTVAFGSPTAADLIEMVRTHTWPLYQRPVQMQSGVGAPLFIFPGIGGMGLDLVALARDLTFPGPVYLAPPQGIDGLAPHRTFDEIVADHIAVLRTVQPHGPYWLLGYSLGGLVALEISRRLRRSGEVIAFLGMIEPELREQDWPYGVWFEYMRKRLLHHWAAFRQISSPRAALRYGSKRIEPLIGRIRRLFGNHSWAPMLTLAERLPAPLAKIWCAETEALDAYRLRPYEGDVTLFATRSGHAALCDPMKIWPSKVNRFDLQWIPGDHMSSLTEPKVKDTADFISAEIAKRQGNP
jgi:thioesterase domain-containing protein